MLFRFFILGFFLLNSELGSARGFELSVAYNNPLGSTAGLNLMYAWDHFAAEVGVGTPYVQGNLAFGGSFKFIFRPGKVFRPYMQLGGTNVSGGISYNGLGSYSGTNIGGGYFGVGSFFEGKHWMSYISANTTPNSTMNAVQAGVGYMFGESSSSSD